MQRQHLVRSLVVFLCILLLSACLPRTTTFTETIVPPEQSPAPEASEPETSSPTATDLDEARAAPVVPEAGFACRGATVPVAPSTIVLNGVERSFITHIPESYLATSAHTLIFAFHGRTSPNHEVRQYFDLEAAMPNAIIVYPSALRQGSGFAWADQGDDVTALRDYVLFDELLKLMTGLYCIDESRVFVVGHSLGAYFANDLACARAPKIRAVASLAGGLQQQRCEIGVSAMLLHHPEDRLVALSEGLKARQVFLENFENQEPRAVSSSLLKEFGCQRFDARQALLLWCQHPFATAYDGRYYPHNWPNKTAFAMRTFFEALP